GAAGIADVAGQPHRTARERIVPELMIDDAVDLRHEPDQEHRVDEGGVVGHDQAAGLLQSFPADNPIAQHATADHDTDKRPAAGTDQPLRVTLACRGRAHAQAQNRERAQREADGADSENGETASGCDYTPTASESPNNVPVR